MFNFIKKSLAISDAAETPEQKARLDTAVDKVLLGYEVGGQSIASMITGLARDGSIITLDVRLPDDSDPETIHRELSQRLHGHGIKEVNLNVTLYKANKPISSAHPASALSENRVSSKGHESVLPKAPNLPKTTDAMSGANQESKHTDANEPPIAKRAPTQASLSPHPRIKHIIVVASGKGGVGKSTTTVNIALALQKLGNRVGILDADIYGPSMPTMLGVAGVKPALENEQFVPIDAHGLAMLSIGSLLDGDNTPVAWRGPKATGALMQLFNQTNWPHLDYLVIDMPPGTGDIQLTLAQRIPVTGAVIVTTPQHIALMDAQKGIEMFNKTNIPILGVVENMALHTCSSCGHTEAIFGAGGGESIAAEYQVPLLGQLPLASAIRAQADLGQPSVIANEGKGDDYAQYYLSIAKNIEANIAKFAKVRDDGRIF
ncbi:MAG: iron-sulfur cluster carrier protein ApbC [Psychrobacter sp.]|nr:iron-sulfur cluster carrier protein ApbC [Psychrobacter sp.]